MVRLVLMMFGACVVLPLLAFSQSFEDVSAAAGVDNSTDNTAPVAWGDYDGDGDQDMFLGTNGGSFDPNDILFRNNGDGTFSDRAAEAGVLGSKDLTFQQGSAWGDYDNDGDLDLFVANPLNKLELYRNLGAGTFENVAAAAGVELPNNSARTGIWGDVDNDGWIDLYIVNLCAPNQLYHNNGDGTFTDVGGCSAGDDCSESATFADYDNDGDLDIFVASVNASILCRNDGGFTFTDVTAAANIGSHLLAGAGAWGDYDNDLDLDLFVAEWVSGEIGYLYRNLGDGAFEEVSDASGIVVPAETGRGVKGAGWADYDNDGWLDLYIIYGALNGDGALAKNILFSNDGDGTFTDVSTASGAADDVANSQGMGWADYDNDGFVDLYVVNEFSFPNRLFHNLGNSNHWVSIRLVGFSSSRDAFGAHVLIRTGVSWQMREVGGGGTGGESQDSIPVEFGLGANTVIDELVIQWPSGVEDTYENLPADQAYTFFEILFADGFESGDVSAWSSAVP